MKQMSLVVFAAALALPPAMWGDEKGPALKPVNVTASTAADEDDPHVSSDGRKLYFASLKEGKWEIMVSTRRSIRQPWPGAELLGDYIRTPADDRGVSLTPERRYPQYLYFGTRKDREQDNFDIYVAANQGLVRDSAFGSPTSVDEVNTKADECNPWLTGNGRYLFFDRKTREGWRTFLVSRPKNAVRTARGFGEARPFKALPVGYHHVTLSPDLRTIFCQGPLAKGRTGLFRCVRKGKGWTKPEPLANLNQPKAPTGDRSPCLSRDGRLLYFASDRPGGKGKMDLWVIPTARLR
jgi:hypothetical protein